MLPSKKVFGKVLLRLIAREDSRDVTDLEKNILEWKNSSRVVLLLTTLLPLLKQITIPATKSSPTPSPCVPFWKAKLSAH